MVEYTTARLDKKMNERVDLGSDAFDEQKNDLKNETFMNDGTHTRHE